MSVHFIIFLSIIFRKNSAKRSRCRGLACVDLCKP